MSQANPTKSELDRYASDYVLNGDQSRAWRLAFPNSKANKKVVNEKASTFNKIERVQERIVELSNKAREIADKEFNIDAAWVLKESKRVYDRCMESSKVTTAKGETIKDVDGNPVYQFQHQGANKSLELIGKNKGVKAFEENINLTAKIKVDKSFNDFYDED